MVREAETQDWELPQDWEDSQVVVEWLERIKKKGSYRNELKHFLNFIHLTPVEIIGKRKETLETPETERWLENQVIQYVDYLYKKRKLKKGTVKAYLRTVQSFVTFHFRKDPLRFLRNEIKHEEIAEVKARNKPKWVLINEELRVLHQACKSNFDKAVLLALAHSGMSPIDVSQLTITERLLEDIGEKRHHYIERDREKSEQLQQTFLSDECLHFTYIYLNERFIDEDIRDHIGEILYTTQKGNSIDSSYLSERFNYLVSIAFGKEKSKDFKVKNLRDILYNASKLAEHSAELTDSLLGWRKKGAKSHYKLNEEVIRVAYDKAFKYLSINGQNISRHKYEELEKSVNDNVSILKAMSTTINTLQEHIDKVEGDLKDLKESNLADITELVGGERAVSQITRALLEKMGLEELIPLDPDIVVRLGGKINVEKEDDQQLPPQNEGDQ